MINKLIHTVNRFFPFTFALLCVSVFTPLYAHATVLYTGGSGSLHTFSSTYWDWTGHTSGDKTVDPVNTLILLPSGGGPTEPFDMRIPTAGGNSDRSWVIYPQKVGGGTLTNTDCSYFSMGFSYSSGGSGVNSFVANTAGDGCINDTYGFYGGNADGSPYWGVTVGINNGGQLANYQYPTGALKVCDSRSECIGAPPPPPTGPTCDTSYTHICGFTPENGTTVTGPNVPFTLDYAVTQADIDEHFSDIVVKLHNIDQNVLLLGFLSPGDITLYDTVATTSGHVSFATTTALADGNYRIEASIKKKIFFDWITVPFDNLNQTISKQFIVGAPTFIGNLTQNGFSILNGTLASTTATSSVALVARCNPLGSFDMIMCLSGLLVPDASQIQATLQGARDGILTRMPWGYITRFVTIVGGNGTTTLSTTYTATVALNTASDTTEISFNPGDMFAGGGALVDSIHSPYDSSVTFRSVFEPIIKLSIALLVIFQIVHDITGSHSHHSEAGDVGGRRRRRT